MGALVRHKSSILPSDSDSPNIIQVKKKKRRPKQIAATADVDSFQARGFTCRAFTYAMEEKRCYLSGDDSISLSSAPLVIKRDAVYAEKQCSLSKCKTWD